MAVKTEPGLQARVASKSTAQMSGAFNLYFLSFLLRLLVLDQTGHIGHR